MATIGAILEFKRLTRAREMPLAEILDDDAETLWPGLPGPSGTGGGGGGGTSGDLLATFVNGVVSVVNTDVTLAASTMTLVKATAPHTVTLPPPALGVVVGITIAAFSSDFVTVLPNGSEFILGLANPMGPFESAVLFSDGTNWYKITGRVSALAASLYLGSVQALPNNTQTTALLDTIANDNSGGHMVDTAGNRIVIPRTWNYAIEAYGSFSTAAGGGLSTPAFLNVALRINGVLTAFLTTSYTTAGFPIAIVPATVPLVVGDYVQISMYQFTGAGQGIYGDPLTSNSPTLLAVTELPS